MTPDDASFDLAVVTNPSAAELQAAWQALRPGGALYGEWHRLPATRARVTDELEQAGFTPPACYWPTGAPARAAAGAWLPLAAPGALRYYARSRSAVKGRSAQSPAPGGRPGAAGTRRHGRGDTALCGGI